MLKEEVVAHSYYGTHRVVQDLESFNGWE
jgi:hypothetical protein